MTRSYDGYGRYKNRGRWWYLVLAAPDEKGKWAVCYSVDRGAVPIMCSHFYVREWALEEEERASEGLGNIADLLNDALKDLNI